MCLMGFENGKSLKHYLVRASLPKFMRVEDMKHLGKELVWSVIL